MSSISDEKSAPREITESSKWGWTQKLPWFIPHERIVIETQEEIDAGYAIRKKNEEERQSYHVKEYRDEAHRPWYAYTMKLNIDSPRRSNPNMIGGDGMIKVLPKLRRN